jgi:hypothetical protein
VATTGADVGMPLALAFGLVLVGTSLRRGAKRRQPFRSAVRKRLGLPGSRRRPLVPERHRWRSGQTGQRIHQADRRSDQPYGRSPGTGLRARPGRALGRQAAAGVEARKGVSWSYVDQSAFGRAIEKF